MTNQKPGNGRKTMDMGLLLFPSPTGSAAMARTAEFIHRFGIAGPPDEAITRFEAIRDTGVEFVRVVPGSRDMPRDVGAGSIQALGIVATRLANASKSEMAGGR